jgi:dienelactone hydrolase
MLAGSTYVPSQEGIAMVTSAANAHADLARHAGTEEFIASVGYCAGAVVVVVVVAVVVDHIEDSESIGCAVKAGVRVGVGIRVGIRVS